MVVQSLYTAVSRCSEEALFSGCIPLMWIVGKVWDLACTAVMVDYQGLTLLFKQATRMMILLVYVGSIAI